MRKYLWRYFVTSTSAFTYGMPLVPYTLELYHWPQLFTPSYNRALCHVTYSKYPSKEGGCSSLPLDFILDVFLALASTMQQKQGRAVLSLGLKTACLCLIALACSANRMGRTCLWSRAEDEGHVEQIHSSLAVPAEPTWLSGQSSPAEHPAKPWELNKYVLSYGTEVLL